MATGLGSNSSSKPSISSGEVARPQIRGRTRGQTPGGDPGGGTTRRTCTTQTPRVTKRTSSLGSPRWTLCPCPPAATRGGTTTQGQEEEEEEAAVGSARPPVIISSSTIAIRGCATTAPTSTPVGAATCVPCAARHPQQVPPLATRESARTGSSLSWSHRCQQPHS